MPGERDRVGMEIYAKIQRPMTNARLDLWMIARDAPESAWSSGSNLLQIDWIFDWISRLEPVRGAAVRTVAQEALQALAKQQYCILARWLDCASKKT